MPATAEKQKQTFKLRGQILLSVAAIGIAAMWILCLYMANLDTKTSDLRDDYHPLNYWLYPASLFSGTIGFLAVLILLVTDDLAELIGAGRPSLAAMGCFVVVIIGLVLSSLFWFLLLQIVLKLFLERA